MNKLRRINWFVTGCFAIAFALEMGLGINIGFVTHALISPAFYDMPYIAIGGAIIAGILVGFGSYGLFVKSEEALIAMKEYADHTNEKFWYVRVISLIALNLIVIVVDILGMLYRLQFLDSRGVGYLAWIGSGLAFVPLLIGIVMTPLVKRPAEMLELEASDNFDRRYISEAYDALEDQPIDIRTKAFNGDLDGALTLALESKAASKQKKLTGRTRKTLTDRKNNSTSPVTVTPIEYEDELPDTTPLPTALRK